MPTDSRLLEIHRAWLGLLQPVGLVVSPPALEKAGLVPVENAVEVQERLLEVVTRPEEDAHRGVDAAPAHAPDLLRLLEHALGWRRGDLLGPGGAADLPATFDVSLPSYGEVLRPTWAARDPGAPERALLLIHQVAAGQNLDEPAADLAGVGWHASPEARFERLLNDSGVRIGLLSNGNALRLVYVPEHQTSGHLTFPVQAMTEVGGRPILAAFHMLLREGTVFNAPPGKSLAEVLADSRNFQNEVSNQLSEQVLGALWELLRGFQEADAIKGGSLLQAATPDEREHIYGGLLTTLMRLVFLLYAEDQGLLPSDPVWVRNYSVAGLARRLRDDQGANPDTMDQRYGAWASLLALFRVVYQGGGHQGLRLPARKGQLFDPDAYPFLEGRARGSLHERTRRIEAPHVSDGCIHRVLQSLLVLDGERLSYRALDVEQIGSVYEAMMGYVVERIAGPSLALRLNRKGSPGFIFFDVAALLEQAPGKRVKWLEEHALCELPAKAATALREATTPEGVLAALERRISARTPRVLPKGALVLQPGEERRRSGSHYTPRSLTKPIVKTTLKPVLAALGENPTAEQILALKVCDPAMGSGAFLVEACRQLGECVVEAWERHASTPALPADETPLLHAKRLVAHRCLYGVDKNPFATDLARLSLWLVTLARDHAFTFLDPVLRCGDSLVGLDLEQIGRFHWERAASDALPLLAGLKTESRATAAQRVRLALLGDDAEEQKRGMFAEAEAMKARARTLGDAVVAAFFAWERPAERETRRRELRAIADIWRPGQPPPVELERAGALLRSGAHGVAPFHWALEFPEVFDRDSGGFDAFVGNPPFLGGSKISSTLGDAMLAWLLASHEDAHGNGDLVAHFFRRAFDLLRVGGGFGLIATNTIAQGDTRATGLRWICKHGGEIIRATRRLKWPGLAAVVVSTVHAVKGPWIGRRLLDGREVATITAFLFPRGTHDDPAPLAANAGRSYSGVKVYGQGFTFDDTDTSGVASALAEMRRLLAKDPRNGERIFPYIGGEEINTSPTHAHHRYVINFGEMSEAEARRWPELMRVVEEKVKPERALLHGNADADRRRERWWLWGRYTPALFRAIAGLEQVLVNSQVSAHLQFALCPAQSVFAHSANVFPVASSAAFCALQSRPHELWARFFGSSLEDRLRYTPSDCFETFPFPEGWETHPALEVAGKAYYEFRAALMVKNDEGLTKTYNRFHDPEEKSPEIVQLRELHAAMDRAVLDAYDWTNLQPSCAFLLDYEEEDEEGSRRRKPWRFRWPDDMRDEVLARLLELNRVRAEQERLAGPGVKRGKVLPLRPRTREVADSAVAEGLGLFGASELREHPPQQAASDTDEEQA
jgi:hypothetical protein